MTLLRCDVEFRTCDGTILRGWHHPTERKSPCIIMWHGLAGICHFRLPPFADRFHKAGFVVLLYDNRNWGDSDGEPRQESNPTLQQIDYYDAFNYAVILHGVDLEKVFTGAPASPVAISSTQLP